MHRADRSLHNMILRRASMLCSLWSLATFCQLLAGPISTETFPVISYLSAKNGSEDFSFTFHDCFNTNSYTVWYKYDVWWDGGSAAQYKENVNIDHVYLTRMLVSTEQLAHIVTNSAINYLLIIMTNRETCEYCRMFSSIAYRGIRANLVRPYGVATMTCASKESKAAQFFYSIAPDANLQLLPFVLLFPNPKNLTNNTTNWYASHLIKSWDGSSFKTWEKAYYMGYTEFKKYLDSYTNTFEAVVSSPTDTTVSVSATDGTTSPQFITVSCPAYSIEGDVVSISLKRSGNIESTLTLHVFCDGQFVTNVTWSDSDDSTKTVSFRSATTGEYTGVSKFSKISVRTLNKSAFTR